MEPKQPFKRAERVADLLRQILSELLMTKVHHHGLEGVTVTGVKMTDDLQHARVYYRVIDADQRVAVARQLPKVRGFLRKEAGHQLNLRYAPELKFEYDESSDYGRRIDALLSSLPKRAEEE
jgi:ribosome-binding factor A